MTSFQVRIHYHNFMGAWGSEIMENDIAADVELYWERFLAKDLGVIPPTISDPDATDFDREKAAKALDAVQISIEQSQSLAERIQAELNIHWPPLNVNDIDALFALVEVQMNHGVLDPLKVEMMRKAIDDYPFIDWSAPREREKIVNKLLQKAENFLRSQMAKEKIILPLTAEHILYG